MNKDNMKDQFFIGPAVEHTPACGKRTLFVNGLQGIEQIETAVKENKTQHVLLGHAGSLDSSKVNQYIEQLTYLLDRGIVVTLEYPVQQHEMMLDTIPISIWQCRNFVPLLTMNIPSIQTINANLTVKVSDIRCAEPGSWCMHFRELTDSNKFTDRAEYEFNSVTAVTIADTVVTQPPVTRKAKESIPVQELVSITTSEIIQIQSEVIPEEENTSNLGLDIEQSEIENKDPIPQQIIPPTKESAAEVYAEGATEDPIAEETKKPKSKK